MYSKSRTRSRSRSTSRSTSGSNPDGKNLEVDGLDLDLEDPSSRTSYLTQDHCDPDKLNYWTQDICDSMADLDLLKLPDDVLYFILSFLKQSDLCKLSLVCTKFYHICSKDSVWLPHVRRIVLYDGPSLR